MRARFRPSKAQAQEFYHTMNKIEEFCRENNIGHSMSYDSYYFTIDDQMYRVSNHSVESSKWHDGRDDDVIYIHASKTRIIDIYTDIENGWKLDGRGNRKEKKNV